MKTTTMTDNHIEEWQIRALEYCPDVFSDEEKLQMFEHIDSCDICKAKIILYSKHLNENEDYYEEEIAPALNFYALISNLTNGKEKEISSIIPFFYYPFLSLDNNFSLLFGVFLYNLFLFIENIKNQLLIDRDFYNEGDFIDIQIKF